MIILRYSIGLYIYIYIVYRSWASCNWATYPEAIFINIYTLVYFSSKVIVLVIKSHDKYQSLNLIWLAHAEKASSGNRSVLVHYRSYWREWRSLVTPWACCIKEGIEPWKSQRWLFTSHVQHPHPCTRCIGGQVAHFARPFESRPADPIRREVYRQLAAISGSSSSAGWVAPIATLPVTPPPLERGTEEGTLQSVPKRKGKRRIKC